MQTMYRSLLRFKCRAMSSVCRVEDIVSYPAETYPLFYKEYDFCPNVSFKVQGMATEFVVDTGCVHTQVTPEQVRAWGLEDEIIVADDGTEYVKVRLGVLGGFFGIMYIKDTPWNLLGMDFL